jgi:hypothetical protein
MTMIVKLYIWHGATGWLAFAPQLQVGAGGATREQALRAARDDARRTAMLLLGEDAISIIDGPPPTEERSRDR